MTDVFSYNSGSLFQALNPAAEPRAASTTSRGSATLDDDVQDAPVTAGDKVYGAPFGATIGGGVLYNRTVYAELGLQVPKTWAEFMANNAKIKAAGIDSGDPDLPGHLDLAAVRARPTSTTSPPPSPTSPSKYTANKAKYATTPAAVKGFQHLQEVHDAGYLNTDFASAKLRGRADASWPTARARTTRC